MQSTRRLAAGVVEILLGVKVQRKSLEDIAKPLTAEDEDTGRGTSGRIPAPATG